MLAWAHGDSSVEEATAVLDHGLACRACGDQLAVMLALADDRAAVVPAPGRRRRTARSTPSGLLAAAAVIMLLIGAALLAPWLRAPGARDPAAAGPAADAGPAVVPAPAGLARFATTAPPGALMVDFLFDPATYANDVPRARAGLQMVVDGRYDEAVRELTRVYETDPMNGETATVLGIALYLSGDDSARTEGLLRQGQALPLDDFANLAAWYLGNLYLRRGDLQEATRVLEALAQFPDDPGTRAQALLERIRGEIR
jgi:hypothetical protein